MANELNQYVMSSYFELIKKVPAEKAIKMIASKQGLTAIEVSKIVDDYYDEAGMTRAVEFDEEEEEFVSDEPVEAPDEMAFENFTTSFHEFKKKMLNESNKNENPVFTAESIGNMSPITDPDHPMYGYNPMDDLTEEEKHMLNLMEELNYTDSMSDDEIIAKCKSNIELYEVTPLGRINEKIATEMIKYTNENNIPDPNQNGGRYRALHHTPGVVNQELANKMTPQEIVEKVRKYEDLYNDVLGFPADMSDDDIVKAVKNGYNGVDKEQMAVEVFYYIDPSEA